jgi:hypothetical protein
MNYRTDYQRHREPSSRSRDDNAYSFEIATVLVFLMLANWFVYASSSIYFDDSYFEYQTYQAERNAELRYLVRLP